MNETSGSVFICVIFIWRIFRTCLVCLLIDPREVHPVDYEVKHPALDDLGLVKVLCDAHELGGKDRTHDEAWEE